MVKTLVIGDIHLGNKINGLLEAQVKCICSIIDSDIYSDIIFMGDLVDHRRPNASVLLALHKVLAYAHESATDTVYALRGNHDSENKSDNGVTVLSLFKELAFIAEHAEMSNIGVLIPHYEDQEKIKTILAEAHSERMEDEEIVFGHFGYTGCLNSAGDEDFTISKDHFKNVTILGHIHNYKEDGNIIVMGTPYTTSFSEKNKTSYYGVIENNIFEKYEITHGPRFVVLPYEELESNLEYLMDPNYFTMLRVLVNEFTEEDSISQYINANLKLPYVEIKYKPQFNDKKDIPDLGDNTFSVDVNMGLINKYIEESETTLSKEELLGGLHLIYENKLDNN